MHLFTCLCHKDCFSLIRSIGACSIMILRMGRTFVYDANSISAFKLLIAVLKCITQLRVFERLLVLHNFVTNSLVHKDDMVEEYRTPDEEYC